MDIKILLIYTFLSFTNTIYSQETVHPLFDTEIVRNVLSIDIEGKEYKNVLVTLKSISPDYFFSDQFRVKVIVEDRDGFKIWKKTLKNAYLYAFSDGQIQVGQPNFNQIIIEPYLGSHVGAIRIKEGVY